MSPCANRLHPEARDLRQPAPQGLAVPRELDKVPLPPYVVEPGDVLLIQPADLDSPVRLPGDQTVLPDGTVSLGRYGALVVSGKTVEQVQEEVRQAIAAQVPDVGAIVVRVVVRQSKVFYVLGEVNAPGSFPLSGRETVLDAILAAGGLTDRASRRGIILSRPTHPDCCRVVLPVCYDEIVQLGDTTTNYQIAPGDRVFVPARSPWEHHKKSSCPPCAGMHVPCPAILDAAPPMPLATLPAPAPPSALEPTHEPVPAPRPLPLEPPPER
jgi:protein involved in polysaccharide export with SLBB domain